MGSIIKTLFRKKGDSIERYEIGAESKNIIVNSTQNKNYNIDNNNTTQPVPITTLEQLLQVIFPNITGESPDIATAFQLNSNIVDNDKFREKIGNIDSLTYYEDGVDDTNFYPQLIIGQSNAQGTVTSFEERTESEGVQQLFKDYKGGGWPMFVLGNGDSSYKDGLNTAFMIDSNGNILRGRWPEMEDAINDIKGNIASIETNVTDLQAVDDKTTINKNTGVFENLYIGKPQTVGLKISYDTTANYGEISFENIPADDTTTTSNE